MSLNDMDELLKRTIFNPNVPGYSQRNGYNLGYGYDAVKDEIDNFEIKESDVWIATYPKSGTTWTQEMVWLLANDLDYEGAKTLLIKRFPFLEMQTLFDWDALEKYQGSKVPFQTSNSIEHAKNLTDNPRCIKTHLPWDLLPKAIKDGAKYPKIIATIRNPKDTCVSYYHHHRLLHFYKGTFEEFATLFLNDKVISSPYWQFTESYWEKRNESNILLLKYEDMKRDLKTEVIKVAKFLNKSLNDDQLAKLVDHLSFKSMKNNPSTNFQPMKNLDADPDADFIRKGIIGDYKNIMTDEIIAKFDKWSNENNKYDITF